MASLRDSLMREPTSPAGPLPRKRAASASPTKAAPDNYSRTDTFTLRVGDLGYVIEYSPTWSIERAASRFLTRYSLGCEWRLRVEALLREQAVPEVERALEWSERSKRYSSKENYRQVGATKRLKLTLNTGLSESEADCSRAQSPPTPVYESREAEDAETRVSEDGGSEWRMDVET